MRFFGKSKEQFAKSAGKSNINSGRTTPDSSSDIADEDGFNPLHNDSTGHTAILSSENESVLTKSEHKAQLTRGEAENNYYHSKESGSPSIKTMYEYFIQVINEEAELRQSSTINTTYDPHVLDELSRQLTTADENTDIKALIRTHLNNQTLKAANQGIAETLLLDDIRASLNEKLGFQPQLQRNMDIADYFIKKAPSRFSALFSKSKQEEGSAKYSGKDPHGVKIAREQIQSLETAVSKLIADQQAPEPANADQATIRMHQ